MKAKLVCVTGGLLLLASSAAMAGPTDYPPECTSDLRPDYYEGGWEKADWWWDYVLCPDPGECLDRCDELADLIAQILLLQDPQDPNALCEYGGFTDGLVERLFDLCTQDCCKTGEDSGTIYGKSYCLAALLGFVNDPGDWFRPPVNTCGFWYQYCCDRAFDYFSYWYPNDEDNTPNDVCRPYVAGDPWGITHDNVREKTCEYPVD